MLLPAINPGESFNDSNRAHPRLPKIMESAFSPDWYMHVLSTIFGYASRCIRSGPLVRFHHLSVQCPIVRDDVAVHSEIPGIDGIRIVSLLDWLTEDR